MKTTPILTFVLALATEQIAPGAASGDEQSKIKVPDKVTLKASAFDLKEVRLEVRVFQ